MKKKQIAITIATVIMLMVFILTLSGCAADISGTYRNPNDNSEYIVLYGDTITLYEDDSQTRSGTFSRSAKTASGYLLIVSYSDSPTEYYWLDESRTTIYHGVRGQVGVSVGEIAFVKE
jgi:uncharacterized protein YceK